MQSTLEISEHWSPGRMAISGSAPGLLIATLREVPGSRMEYHNEYHAEDFA
ncbi:MAG: hypothetical protein IAF94_12600 [Pirellulaceae bacterium]|nr:hypothetical protein [Pirellulaceae bacterium]